MKLIAAGLIVALVAAIQCSSSNSVEAASAVGRFAPDRYEGIPEMCLMPMDMGVCRAREKRFYFDTRRMKCAMFFWGGCGGNNNNFKSMDDCNKFCLDSYEVPDEKPAPAATPVKYNSRSSAKEVVLAKTNSNSNNNNNNHNDNAESSSNISSNYKNFQVNKSKGYTNASSKEEDYDDSNEN